MADYQHRVILHFLACPVKIRTLTSESAVLYTGGGTVEAASLLQCCTIKMFSCAVNVFVLMGVAMVLATPQPHPQRGAGRLGRSADLFGHVLDKFARRKPGKYRNPEYEGGYGKPDGYGNPGPYPGRPYPSYSGANSAASASAQAGSLAGGPHGGAGALSQSQAHSQSASLGLGPFGASVSQSQASANSAAGAGVGYRPSRPGYYHQGRPGHYQPPDQDRFEDY